MNRTLISKLLVFFTLIASSFGGCGGTPKKIMTPVGPKPPPKTFKADIPPEKFPESSVEGVFKSLPDPNLPYILGPNDKVLLKIKGKPELDQELVVSIDGKIMPKYLEPIKVEGETIEWLQNKLKIKYEEDEIVRKPVVSVALKEGRQLFVFVAGSLPKSGRLTITGQPSLLHVLTLAGWTEDSPVRRVTVLRNDEDENNELVTRFKSINLDNLLFGKSLSDNIILEPSDLVIAAKDFPITVSGAVKKQGKYNLDGAMRRSIAWVIAKAEGLERDAVLNAARIIAKDGTERLIDLNPILFGGVNEKIDFISPGETLYIPKSKKIKIYILGMVNRPGQFSVDEGMTVTQAIALADFERFGAVMDAATLITGYFDKREDGKTYPESITFDLAAVLEGNIEQNYRMDDGSVLFIPESTTSDVLDFLNRLLAPLRGMVSTANQVQDISESAPK